MTHQLSSLSCIYLDLHETHLPKHVTPQILFDRQNLLDIQADLSSMVEPFSQSDIDQVVKHLSSVTMPCVSIGWF